MRLAMQCERSVACVKRTSYVRIRLLVVGIVTVALPSAASAVCSDEVKECTAWAEAGECSSNPKYMHVKCKQACGMCDTSCENRDKSGACELWASSGECENNPAYMKLKCASSCGTCDQLDYKKRCPIDPNRTEAVPPGKMTQTFERALSNFPHLEPQLLSSDPWVISFDKFMSPEEVEAILKHGEGRYVRSTASGGRADGEFIPLTSEIRTSWTTWCDNATCLEDPLVAQVIERVADVSQVPANNSEFVQLLRYLPCEHLRAPDCQFYRRHHDTIPELATMQPGPRVYTFFLYLSDVEEGGGTKFDGGFTVEPKAGKAVLWPAVFEDRPFVSDSRTHHEALPVLKGTKYAANFWLHQYDYVGPHHAGCTA